jgi:hypothetical protein
MSYFSESETEAVCDKHGLGQPVLLARFETMIFRLKIGSFATVT